MAAVDRIASYKEAKITILSATLTKAMCQYFVEVLRPRPFSVFSLPASRPLLYYEVRNIIASPPLEDDLFRLLGMPHLIDRTGIVYCPTRNKCRSWAQKLRDKGHTAEAYHSDVSKETRLEVYSRWMSGATRIIVATVSDPGP